ncbi:rCG54647 [Rattus norvegicus]|uniref:RCG54647 n=1 Tax=Rattus norvegicus TaxID=10116 RepID=A6J877_RAT|nr:rCG54647 [Rattus norvegicus]
MYIGNLLFNRIIWIFRKTSATLLVVLIIPAVSRILTALARPPPLSLRFYFQSFQNCRGSALLALSQGIGWLPLLVYV